MSDKNVQAAPPEKNLETQIDSLLSQIGHPQSSGAKVVPGNQAKPIAAEPAQAKSALAADVSGDALAEQIQNLLDDAKSGAAPDKAAVAAGVDRIDQALAADADKAIEGHFETSEEAGVRLDSPMGGPAGSSPSTEDEDAAAAEEVDEPDLEGAFASPEDLLKETVKPPAPVAVQPTPVAAAKTATALSGDAAAVGRELDEQLQDHPAAATVTEKAARPAKIKKPRKKIDAMAAVRGVFVLVNKPLLNCSASTRNTIGWIGLITLFNGSILLASHTIFPSRSQAAETSEVAAAEPRHEAEAPKEKEGGEAKHDKPKSKNDKPKKADKKAKKPAKSE